MPPKIRELIAELEKAGFEKVGGRGSHRSFEHPDSRHKVTISGSLGADAKPYQVKLVGNAVKEPKQ